MQSQRKKGFQIAWAIDFICKCDTYALKFSCQATWKTFLEVHSRNEKEKGKNLSGVDSMGWE